MVEVAGEVAATLAVDGVVVVEWGDKFDDYLPTDHLSVTLSHAGEHTRKIIVRGPYDLVARLQKKI